MSVDLKLDLIVLNATGGYKVGSFFGIFVGGLTIYLRLNL